MDDVIPGVDFIFCYDPTRSHDGNKRVIFEENLSKAGLVLSRMKAKVIHTLNLTTQLIYHFSIQETVSSWCALLSKF